MNKPPILIRNFRPNLAEQQRRHCQVIDTRWFEDDAVHKIISDGAS